MAKKCAPLGLIWSTLFAQTWLSKYLGALKYFFHTLFYLFQLSMAMNAHNFRKCLPAVEMKTFCSQKWSITVKNWNFGYQGDSNG